MSKSSINNWTEQKYVAAEAVAVVHIGISEITEY